MMKRFFPFAAALATLAVAGAALAHQFAAGGVTVTHPWSRPAAAGSNGAGFMGLTNTGATPMTFVSVATPGAAGAMIHRTRSVNGVYSMAPAANLVVEPGETVAFAPGGYHVMFTGLKAPLAAGGKLPATLTFKRGTQTIALPVTFNVQGGAAKAHEH